MNNKVPLVSITMSTYNVETFINKSLDCIVNQTLKDVEIICIDDGSTDSTLKILNSYALKDSRLKVIGKKKNEGLAVARNQALTLARGKYIAFVDGDDLMDLSLFEKAYQKAEKTSSDIVIWDYCAFYKETEIEQLKVQSSKLKQLSNDNIEKLLQLPAFTWVKLVKTSVARALNIHFPIGLTRQDIPVHWQLLTSDLKVALLPEKLSYYRQQPNATTYKKDARLFDIAKVLDITKAYLIKSNQYKRYQNLFLKKQLNMLFGMYDIVAKKYKLEAFQLLKNRIEEEHISYINSNKPLRKQARWFYKSIEGNIVGEIQFKAWEFSRAVFRLLK